MPNITFSRRSDAQFASQPIRASKVLPQWLKELPHDVTKPEDDLSFPTGTAKRCMPMFDAMSAGYIIGLPAATYIVADEDGNINLNWRVSNYQAVEGHSKEQIGNGADGKDVFKWINSWQVKTPPGYSTLFTHPIGHKLPFTCFSAIVDTDTYDNVVNFPFVWNEFPYKDVLDQGTPIIQAIPFLRDKWEMEIVDSVDFSEESRKVEAAEHYYKRLVRQTKDW